MHFILSYFTQSVFMGVIYHITRSKLYNLTYYNIYSFYPFLAIQIYSKNDKLCYVVHIYVHMHKLIKYNELIDS